MHVGGYPAFRGSLPALLIRFASERDISLRQLEATLAAAALLRLYAVPVLTASTSQTHPRELEIQALGAMEAEAAQCGTGIAPLIKARSPEAAAILRQIARWIASDVPAPLAMTDPARYRKLARLRSEIILRGYYDYFHRIAERA